MGLYYLTYRKVLVKLLKRRWLPSVHADGNDYYHACLLFPEGEGEVDVFVTCVDHSGEVLEFVDDNSAKLWFMLEYGG